jgi:hypothetical protein
MIREERKNVSGEFRGKFGETQMVHFNGRPWTSATIINEPDPNIGAFHATTGKYAGMVDNTFTDSGFITAFTFDPSGGSVHAMWHLD